MVGYVLGRYLEVPTAFVVLGAALPDLIDKPLAMVGVVDLYHTIGHSLLLLIIVGILAVRSRRWLAVWIGWTSHLFLDAFQMVINGRPEDAQFLLYPFVHHEPAVRLPPVEFAVEYVGSPAFVVEVVIWLVFIGVLIRDPPDWQYLTAVER